MDFKSKGFSLFFVIGLGIGVSVLSSASAQEFGEESGTGKNVAAEMQSQAQALPATSSSAVSARQMAIDFINNAGVALGWNDDKEIFVALGVANYPTINPAMDPNFGQARALKAIEAGLFAKQDIIEYVRVDLDYSSLVSLPETGLGTEFDQQRAELEQELQNAIFQYQTALVEVGDAEAANIQGVTMGELVKEGIAGFIQKNLNPSLDVESMEAEKRTNLEEAEASLLQFQSRLEDLEAKAEEMRGQVQQSQGFDIETYSALTVVGSIMIAQFESWMDNNYETSMLYVWSPSQEQQVRNILAGRSEAVPPGNQTISDYIRNTDWSSAIGGRKFADTSGEMHVIGIGAWPLRGNSSAQRRTAEGFALRMAQSQVALAFSGDVVSKSRAQAKADEIATGGMEGETETQFAANFAQELSESTQMTLQGVQTRYSNLLQHPISGQQMHVVVVSSSAAQAAVAKDMEAALFQGAAAVAGIQQFSRGVRDGMEQTLEQKRADTAAFREGQAEGREAAVPSAAPAASQNAAGTAGSAGEEPVEPGQPASVTGGGSDPDAFGW